MTDPYAKEKAAYEERMVAVRRCQANLAKERGTTMASIRTKWHHAYGPDTKDRLVEAELTLMRNEQSTS